MTETFLGVLVGLLAWFAASTLFAVAWSIAKRAERNRRRRDAARTRAARRVTTVDTIQREHYLVVIRNGRREVIDLGAEADQLETWVNDPINHQETS